MDAKVLSINRDFLMGMMLDIAAAVPFKGSHDLKMDAKYRYVGKALLTGNAKQTAISIENRDGLEGKHIIISKYQEDISDKGWCLLVSELDLNRNHVRPMSDPELIQEAFDEYSAKYGTVAMKQRRSNTVYIPRSKSRPRHIVHGFVDNKQGDL